jgi:hypothetical protein
MLSRWEDRSRRLAFDFAGVPEPHVFLERSASTWQARVLSITVSGKSAALAAEIGICTGYYQLKVALNRAALADFWSRPYAQQSKTRTDASEQF